MSKMKFEFQGALSNGAFYDKNSTKSIVMELNDDNLTIPEILNEFQNFLRAAGYYFDRPGAGRRQRHRHRLGLPRFARAPTPPRHFLGHDGCDCDSRRLDWRGTHALGHSVFKAVGRCIAAVDWRETSH